MNAIFKSNILKYDNILYFVLFLFFAALFSKDRDIVAVYYLFTLLGIYSLTKKHIRFRELPKEIWRYYYLVLFLVILITISIALYDQREVFFQYRYAVYRDLILLPFIFAAFFASNIKIETVFKIIVITALFTTFQVTMIYIYKPMRTVGWLSDPVNRGNIGMLAGVTSLVAVIYFQNHWWKIISFISFLSGTLLSILSLTRSGWSALVIVVITLFIQLYKTNKSAFKYALLICATIILITFLLGDHLPIIARIKHTIYAFNSFFSGANTNTSTGDRLALWHASILAFNDKPIFGWGWSNSETFIEYFWREGKVAATLFKTHTHYGHPHSEYFLFLGELGILGITAFLAMVIYPFQFFIRKLLSYNKQKDREGAFYCLISIVVYESVLEFCLFDDALSQRLFMLPMIIVTVISFTLCSKPSQSNIHLADH